MPFVKNPQCKICQSRIRDKIDSMLSDNQSSTEIIKFAKSKDLKISKNNIFTHKNKHKTITKADLEAEKSDRKSKKDFKKRVSNIVDYQLVLQEIVSRAFTAIQENKLKPSIMEALKAIELLQRSDHGSPVENAILNFIQGVSLGRDNSKA